MRDGLWLYEDADIFENVEGKHGWRCIEDDLNYYRRPMYRTSRSKGFLCRVSYVLPKEYAL